MKAQFFQQIYLVQYVATNNGQIELSINNKLFILENDTDSCNVYEPISNDFIDEVACYQFNPDLGVNDYPNDLILDYIVINLMD